MKEKRARVIFCDFDGTITVNDNIVAIIKHFDPPGWQPIVDDIIAQRVTIQDGVGALFRLLPSARRAEIEAYALDNIEIREGFSELLAYCREAQIDFYVTSGGLDFFVYPTLEPYPIAHDHIYCNGSDFGGEWIRVTWPHPCDAECASGGCGMCKTTVMRRFPPERYERILIGDSVTDFEGAQLADLVFSRSHLTKKCRELGVPSVPYETFNEVLDHLKNMPSKQT
ncbi:2-hydroxy-3-keto-5-methylthiopentenyl-1-phosphate phosphatase [Paenibacillus sp. IB182496]|uniref:2-hydroxy-3-keto-5-methylthiopentenyl-1-phosphate phosphatase n=1 Tax=Paenibacillus sabuli TaxID=2772509 RepID=A0A927BT84_9BACL|nr:2-hydroxy-3-keto-5-methylthiopentenyl-1-phosphate phosphatase [Paenibacillus sabuli]MBD2845104.1 2-hydroxy-3-keto-5-methylthiopentenyl-1-phosphate phosphatase [Paenibacillus sabuli]